MDISEFATTSLFRYTRIKIHVHLISELNILHRWLLDTVVKNYATLNNRTKQLQSCSHKCVQESQSVASDTPSRISVQSNPFKPIRDLLAVKVQINISYIFLCVCVCVYILFMLENKFEYEFFLYRRKV